MEKINLKKSVLNFGEESCNFEMNVAMFKYVPVIGLPDSEMQSKAFKCPMIIENGKTTWMNEDASELVAGSIDDSNETETDSKDVQLVNYLNGEKWYKSNDVYMAYVNDYDYDADIDEDDNMCDIDEDCVYDTDTDDGIDDQCISPIPYSLADSPNSSLFNDEVSNDGLSDSSLWDNEWIKHFIRSRHQNIGRKQRKIHNCSVPRYKNSYMNDLLFEEEDSPTQVLFDASPDKIIPDIEKASDFERFVLLDLPNIPSDYEPSFDEEENRKQWEAAIEEEKAKYLQHAMSINKSLKTKLSNAKVGDLKAAKKMSKSLYLHTATRKRFPKYFRGRKYIIKLVKKLNKRNKKCNSLNVKHTYEGRGLRYIKKSTAPAFQKMKGKAESCVLETVSTSAF